MLEQVVRELADGEDVDEVEEELQRRHRLGLAPSGDLWFSDSAGGYYMRRVAAITRPIEDDESAEDTPETA